MRGLTDLLIVLGFLSLCTAQLSCVIYRVGDFEGSIECTDSSPSAISGVTPPSTNDNTLNFRDSFSVNPVFGGLLGGSLTGNTFSSPTLSSMTQGNNGINTFSGGAIPILNGQVSFVFPSPSGAGTNGVLASPGSTGTLIWGRDTPDLIIGAWSMVDASVAPSE